MGMKSMINKVKLISGLVPRTDIGDGKQRRTYAYNRGECLE